MFVGEIAINTPNIISRLSFPKFTGH
jgi:hypothetical protein